MGEYMNTATWSHYTWQRGMTVPTNHAVTIIGWDDDYPADNFLEGHRPPQDGAWLVKNIWGSGENEFPNRATGLWGLPIDPDDPAKGGSGYFWLSYYDQSISLPVVYLFDNTLFGAAAESGLDPKTVVRHQHDFVPNNLITPIPCDGEARMANVFTADCDQMLTSFSFMTDAPDTAVSYKLCLLGQGFTSPEDGVPAAEGEAVCEYAGFHTVALAEQIPVGEGQSFSIVLTYRMADGSSAYAASISYGKEAPNVKEGFFSRYSTAVIGRGESFAFRDGSWADMACRDGLLTLFGDPDVLEEIKAYDLQLDNFNIKVYGIVR